MWTRSLAWIGRGPPKPEETEIEKPRYDFIISWDEINIEDFVNYLKKEKKPPLTDEQTIKKYLNLLSKYYGGKEITTMEELREIVYSVDKSWNNFAKASRNLIHYLVSRDKLDESMANKILQLFKIKETGVREVYPEDEDIVKAYELIKQKWDDDTVMLFKFLVFTGIRLKQALEALRNFDKSKLKFEGKVAYYPISQVAKGKKRAFIAVMPAEFAKNLKPINLSYSSAQDRLNPKRWKPPIESKVDANAIRKWCDNFFVKHGVPESISDFMQGRASVTVGSKHYLNKVKQAVDWYSRIVDKFPIHP